MKHLTPFLPFVLIPLLITAPLSAQILENPAAPGNSPEPQDLQIRVIAGNSGSASVNSEAGSGFMVEVTGSDGAPVVDAAVAVRLPDTEPTGTFADGSHAVVSYTDQSGHARLAAVKWGNTPGIVAIRVTAVKGTAHAGVLIEKTLTAISAPSVAAESPAAAPMPIMTEPLPAAPAQIATTPQPIPVPKSATVQSPTTSTLPATHALTPAAAPLKPQPSVSVTSSVPPGSQSHSHKKWIVIAAIAAGAGAGLAFAGRGKSSGSSAPAPSLSIGSPTVSVGHP